MEARGVPRVDPNDALVRASQLEASDVDDHISTEELSWLLGKSANAIRRLIRGGEIEAVRVPGAFRIPREEAMRLSRERIEAEAGRTLGDRELERLIDSVIATNREQRA